MARHRADYCGARRTEFVGFQVTPGEKSQLKDRAERAGLLLSEYARETCLERTFAPVREAPRRSPEAVALLGELHAVGNNLNQLARIANTEGATPQQHILAACIDRLKAALSRVIAL